MWEVGAVIYRWNFAGAVFDFIRDVWCRRVKNVRLSSRYHDEPDSDDRWIFKKNRCVHVCSLVFSAGNLWRRRQEHIRWWLLLEVVFVLVLADVFYRFKEVKFYYEIFFRYVGTPFIAAVPIIFLCVKKLKNKNELAERRKDETI